MATAPGMRIRVNDGGMVYANLAQSMASVLIVASNGDTTATQEVSPVRVSSQAEFVQYFTTFAKTSPLAVAWYQALQAGCRDIRLQVLEGNTDTLKYQNLHTVYKNLEDYDVDAIVIAGLDGDTAPTTPVISDNFDYAALNADVTEVVDESITTAGSGETSKVAFTLAHKFIVEDTMTVKVTDVATTAFSVNYVTGVVTMDVAPGDNKTLKFSYSYYDLADADRDFAHQLAGFCETISARTKITLGYIGLQSAANTNLDTRNTYVTTMTTTPWVLSKFVSVIAGPKAKFEWSDGTLYTDKGVGAYGAFATMLAAQSSTTNKVLPGALTTDYDLSSAQLDKMCIANIVTFRRKNGQVVVTDGVTTAGASSDYTRFTTVKIVKEVINSTRLAADPFIGEPNSMSQRNSLRTAIDNALLAMQQAGALEAYRFNINSGVTGVIDGNVTVDIQIVPVFEIRTISINVTLKPSLD